jgi:hypothetical protein
MPAGRVDQPNDALSVRCLRTVDQFNARFGAARSASTQPASAKSGTCGWNSYRDALDNTLEPAVAGLAQHGERATPRSLGGKMGLLVLGYLGRQTGSFQMFLIL